MESAYESVCNVQPVLAGEASSQRIAWIAKREAWWHSHCGQKDMPWSQSQQ